MWWTLIQPHSFQGLDEARINIDPSLNCESRMENCGYSLGRKLICHSCCEDINPAGVKKFNDMSKTCTSVIPCCEKLICQKREQGHPLGWVSKLRQKRKRKADSQGDNPNPLLSHKIASFFVSVNTSSFYVILFMISMLLFNLLKYHFIAQMFLYKKLLVHFIWNLIFFITPFK